MSTNALVSSLEYYMDDLVDCFEDFVKKSLLVISVALGTIILMVMYVLKVLAERAGNAPNSAPTNIEPQSRCRDYNCTALTTAYRAEEDEPERIISDTTIESGTESPTDTRRYNKPEPITSNYLMNAENTASFSAQVASRPSFDEKVLREIGLSSCSKPCNTSERTVPHNDSESRSTINRPQAQACIAKHHLSDARPCSKYIAIRTSCCSMCCVDDDRR